MPWVDEKKCINCGLCVRKCPVNAISLKSGKAIIDMEKCIRCGKCHDACPQGAIRHDSERIAYEIEENIEKTKKLLNNFKDKKEKKATIERIIKHYNKEMTVAEETIKKLKELDFSYGKTFKGYLFNRIEKMGNKKYNHAGCDSDNKSFGNFLFQFVPKLRMKRKVKFTIRTSKKPKKINENTVTIWSNFENINLKKHQFSNQNLEM